MGLFDKNGRKLPFGLFDFNGDGKTTLDEEILAYKIYEEFAKEESNNNSNRFGTVNLGSHNSDKYEWRLFCKDGLKFGVDPKDYETEEKYSKALEQAKFSWRGSCEDGLELGVDPEDYETEDEYYEAIEETKESADTIEMSFNFSVECPALDKLNKIKEEDFPNKRRYNAAYTLANEFLIYSDKEYKQKEKSCCKFIIENADKILAANYLSHDNGFLYAQAIKDNFTLPCSLPGEDETREMGFSQVLVKIAKRNAPLSFEIWDWCLKQFLPYSKYYENVGNELSTEVIDELYSFPNRYKTQLVHYLADNPDFFKLMITAGDDVPSSLSELIAEAIKEELYPTAESLFKRGLEQTGGHWKKINALTREVILDCENEEELESIEYFRDALLPLVKAIPNGMVQDEIPEWEKHVSEYINRVENACEQYAFTRKNAWRKTVPNGKKYGLDPRDYDTQQEYLEALNEEKYGWREGYRDDDYGLNPDDFETENEYQDALNAKSKEARPQEQSEKKQQLSRQAEMKEYANDKTVYTYCGVLLPFSSRPYSFRTEDTTIQLGDTVIVPVGEDENKTKGTVVSIGQYLRVGVPCPVEKTKMIIRKFKEEQTDG